jgi:dTDP-4-dehydrorhamnose 3,5-epimerase-like enzyme
MQYKQSVRLVSLTPKGDERGKLIALESSNWNLSVIPFEIKRVYYLYDTSPAAVRGRHAHKNLKQFLVCTNGSCTIVCSDGRKQFEFILNWPDKGLLIEGLIWREMKDFSKGSVLMVLASEHYDESDYIRDYAQFVEEAAK